MCFGTKSNCNLHPNQRGLFTEIQHQNKGILVIIKTSTYVGPNQMQFKKPEQNYKRIGSNLFCLFSHPLHSSFNVYYKIRFEFWNLQNAHAFILRRHFANKKRSFNHGCNAITISNSISTLLANSILAICTHLRNINCDVSKM